MEMPESSPPVEMEGWWLQPCATWPEVSEHTYTVWRQRERAKSRLPPADAKVALAFGYAARLTYGERRDWLQLMGQLALDWSAAGFETPWKQVRAAVKEGWTVAREQGQAQEQAKLETREAHSSAEGPSTEHPVHGGRMVDHGT